jgi:hypothetical protein
LRTVPDGRVEFRAARHGGAGRRRARRGRCRGQPRCRSSTGASR